MPKKKSKNEKKEILVSCKTWKEHFIMLTAIVYVQHYYNYEFKKVRKIYFAEIFDKVVAHLKNLDSEPLDTCEAVKKARKK